jgi:hypothetical protein
MRPSTELLVDSAIADGFAVLVFSERDLVGAVVGHKLKIDRSRTVKAEIRKDYKEGWVFLKSL